MLLLSPGQKPKCGFCPWLPTTTPSKKKVQAMKKTFRSKGPNTMEKSQRAQGQEPDCISSRDTCNSLFCIPVPSESRLLWVFHSYEQLSWLSTGGWQRIRLSTCWTPNIQATITSVFALFVPFWFPVVTSTTKSSPPHRRKDSQTQPLSPYTVQNIAKFRK